MKSPIKDPKVLIIDDEADIRHLLAMSLVQLNIEVDCAKDVAEGMRYLQKQSYNLCLTDMKLPDGNGLSIVEHCHKNLPQMPIVVITAFGNTDTAVKAMKLGAFDFVAKPIELVQLRHLIQNAFKYNAEETAAEKIYPIDFFNGSSTAISNFREQLSKINKSNAPVIINGASGTEKETVAQYIHDQSSRAEYEAVHLDCSTQQQEEIDQLLFKTSDPDKNLLIKAHQSSLIINNVHLLSKASQKRLLQVLETKSLKINDDKEQIIDIRVLACSSENLDKYVASLELREDLFFRLDVLRLSIPSISQRSEDFSDLLNYCLSSLSIDKTLTSNASAKLEKYDFPYNYRELRKILIKANHQSVTEEISHDDLDFSYASNIQAASQNQAESFISSRGDLSLDEYVTEIERHEIRAALNQTRWNRTEAAKLLGISFRTIRYKIKKLEIE